VPDIVRAAFLDTGEQLRRPVARTLLSGLIDRPRTDNVAPGPFRRPRRRADRRWGRRPAR
jgi:hypothetical protein